MKPALVVSGHTMGLGVVRALGKMGVPIVMAHYDERDMAHLSKWVVEAVEAPHPEEEEERFLALLGSLADRYEGSLLVPASDEALVTVSRHKDALSRRYMVACPDWPVAQKIIEKRYTYALAEEQGVPVPKTVVPQNFAEARTYADGAAFPCLVKPSQSHLYYDRFGRKMVVAENADELLQFYGEATTAGFEVMLQEIIPGDDREGVNYNAYLWNGVPLVELTAAKVRNAPPGFGSPRVTVSQEVPEVLEPGRRILKALSYCGYANVEFKRDIRDGVYKLMEINGRHNLSSLLNVRCGINFPWLEYQHLMEGVLPEQRAFTPGVYWVDITRDVGYSAMYLRRERYSLWQYLEPYVKPHVFAIFDLQDFQPFYRRAAFLAGKGLEALFARLQRGGKR